MKFFLVVLLGTFLLDCGNKSTSTETPTTSFLDTTTIQTKTYYTVLESTQTRNFKNYEILIDSNSISADDIRQSVKMFVVAECTSMPCNGIGIWDNQKAYSLYKAKSYNPAWRKENWPFICEHYVADYNVTVNELNLFPFVDSEYRRWGGTKARPKEHSFELQ
ncbi:hypothetical protein [Spirosoma endbachense]|uniref:Uncharacterized protein n=1 Tax=Spirosoma endbachense TaxID=2666025 RepID=A0A6P1VTA9_9BACT|nr:hypothetical protein [Spirosoma endbachense]QHV96333.1 hypothetical protein GJR95_15475 [Spirosoma endbachense]